MNRPTVLVVEDNVLDLERYRMMLSKDYDLMEAYTVSQAKELLPLADLVILDMRLPDGEGPEILEWMDRQNILTPVIAASAYSEYEAKTVNQVVYWIDKPVSDERLTATVQEALRVGQSIIEIKKHDTQLGEFLNRNLF